MLLAKKAEGKLRASIASDRGAIPFGLLLARAGSTDTDGALRTGDVLDGRQTGPINIATTEHERIGSVEFFLDGASYAVQNRAPFAMAGDDGGVFSELSLPSGRHSVKAVAYSGPDGQGQELAWVTAELLIKNPGGTQIAAAATQKAPPKPRFPDTGSIDLVLMAGGSDLALGALRNGDTVDLKGTSMNVTVDPLPAIGSVKFFLDGEPYTIENNPPFAMGGDQNDFVNEWRLTTGKHTLEAIAYSADDASGRVVGEVGVSIEVINGDDPSAGPGGPLRWPRPQVSASPRTPPDNADVIELGSGEDAIFKVNGKRHNVLHIKGGRNIQIIGGHFTVNGGGFGQGDRKARRIYIEGAKGIVHIEGVLIDASGGAQGDGIAINAKDAIVQVQNSRIEVKGSAGHHSDIIQAWGGVKELRVDRLTGASNYQGIFLKEEDDRGAKIGKVVLSNVNITSRPGEKGGHMLWIAGGYPAEVENFYIQPRSGHDLGRAVWPQKGGNNQVCVPEAFKGCVKGGKPPGGDFVPASRVGANYR